MSPRGTFKQMVLDIAQEISHKGLVGTASGNVSMRLPEGGLLAITPSRIPYSRMTREDIIIVDLDGEPVEGAGVPSTETLIHAAVYRVRPDVQAILHTHSTFATVAAVAGLEIPPIADEMVVYVGGPVKVAEYAFPGSQELAQSAAMALEGRNAVLLRNHGLLGVGTTLEEAMNICELVERIAKVFIYAHLLGKAHSLHPDIVKAEESLFYMRRVAENQLEEL